MNKNIIELKNQQLASVVGGEKWVNPIGWITEMSCSNCGHYIVWAGCYEGQIFDCPKCGKHTFKGMRELIP